jgi:hypothetical protein
MVASWLTVLLIVLIGVLVLRRVVRGVSGNAHRLCRECGFSHPPDARFCRRGGNKLA